MKLVIPDLVSERSEARSVGNPFWEISVEAGTATFESDLSEFQRAAHVNAVVWSFQRRRYWKGGTILDVPEWIPDTPRFASLAHEVGNDELH